MTEYFSHRDAYSPRLWPQMVVCVVGGALIGAVTAAVLGPWGIFVGIVLGAAFGSGVSRWTWSRWRRCHPILPIEEIARRSARGN